MFPSLTETFIFGEIAELRRRGLPLELFALTPLKDGWTCQPDAQQLAGEVTYAAPLLSWRVLTANLRWLVRRPARYLGTLGFLTAAAWRNPVHWAKAVYVFFRAAEFADHMRRRDVGHIHAHWATYPATAAYVVSRVLGIPFSITAHVYDATLIRSLMREKVRRARFIVTCNAWSARRLAALVPEAGPRIFLNYHGITLERFVPDGSSPAPAPEGVFRIFSCGSLHPRKGFPVLLEAFRRLRDRGRAFTCTILGEGPERGRLERLIAAHGLQQHVTLLGARPHREVLRQYGEADLFVLACMTDYLGWREVFADPVLLLEVGLAIPFRLLTDGIPNVLVEAMAMGLPVVSTTVAGVPELIEDGRTGLLVPEQDPGALATAIERLMDDPALRDRLRTNARADVHARFDRRRNVQDLVRILDPSTVGNVS